MKLSAAIDLTTPKANAIAQIDTAYGGAFKAANTMDDLYRVKVALAQSALVGTAPDPSLTAEANLKGLTVTALCNQIVAKRTAQVQAIATLEAARQAAKAQISAITDQHALISTLATILAGLK